MVKEEKRIVEGETAVKLPQQNQTVASGVEAVPGKCPTCGRDKVNS